MSNHSGGETFIKHTLEQLVNAKEGKKLPNLLSSAKQALAALEKKDPDLQAMQTVFQPFQIACQSRQPILATTAIDCLGKLFTYNYWGRCNTSSELNEDDENGVVSPLTAAEMATTSLSPSVNSPVKTNSSQLKMDLDDDRDGFDIDKNERSFGIVGQVVDTICDAFIGETTDDKLQLQIVKALMSAISSSDPKSAIHGAVLLRAIRATYNIFLFSKTQTTQMLAQTTLQQMVQALFGRVSPPILPKPMIREVSMVAAEQTGSLQNSIILDTPNRGSIATETNNQDSSASITVGAQDSNDAIKRRKDPLNLTYKDLHLVFRALCKLSMKPIPPQEGAGTDLKTPSMRSKLLALHLINLILSTHLYVFTTQTPILFPINTTRENSQFIHAVKQYLCLSLSRNTVSTIPQVFDVSMEIFGKALVGLRTALKRELSVVFTEIIIPIVEAKTAVTFHQRTSLLKALLRILSDPNADGGKILVEIYLNYDCDLEASAQENIWERLINTLSMSIQENNNAPNIPLSQITIPSGVSYSNGPPSLTTASLVTYSKDQIRELSSTTADHNELKRRGLELLVRGILKPLVSWIQANNEKDAESGLNLLKEGDKPLVDDPTQFQNLKHRKQVLLEGIKRFNTKPKRFVLNLFELHCFFLLHTEGLNKTMIGEFLGEGDEENIAIMHAFVDEMEFSHMPFVTALRTFLQSFRLPGESQKIDRFMLKFAGRYLQGNPTSFSSADTAYVLAYSVIMLNTDQHNTQVKKRMTKSDFLKNNRGIDEGKDVPPVILEAIFDEIQTNEIVMKEEQASKATPAGNSPALAHKKDPGESMALKTEALFNNIMKANKRSGTATPSAEGQSPQKSTFFTASHYEHVKPMFSIIWMAILSAISGPLQDSDSTELIRIALDGFKYSSKIVCMFEMEAERKSFLSTLAKCTHLNNLYDLKPKNVEAITCLLDIALTSGNHIGENWMDVVLAISQLEKIGQLTAELANQKGPIDPRARPNSPKKEVRLLNEEAIAGALCQSMTLTVDKVFASSAKLNGGAIVEFVKAMCIVSWDEITNTSATAEHPRMYCLQRLVEISYYNMNRIRVEWSNLWAILGEHFNKVGCHNNTQVCFFAIDKLRQLAMKFLELEELPNFKFQKDFLKPFEFILANNPDVKIKDMALACLQQMIQAKAKSMKSGWKAMFGAFIRAAKEPHANMTLAFDIVKSIFKNYFENIVANLAFPDFVSCIVIFCQNKKYSKTSLQAIELLRQSFPRIPELAKAPGGTKILQSTATPTEKIMAEMIAGTPAALLILNGLEKASQGLAISTLAPVTPSMENVSSTASIEDIYFKFWFPVFHALYLVIMTCELEVRTRALNHLFDALKVQGATFTRDSWEIVANGVLFPIFDDLKTQSLRVVEYVSKFASKEERDMWVSTTMIQLMFCVDGIFDLLIVCMTQENETLARIGSTCLQQFIETNLHKMDDNLWEKVCSIFIHLFRPTGVVAPSETDEADVEISASPNNCKSLTNQKDFPGIITNVFSLTSYPNSTEVLSSGSDSVYKSLSSKHVFVLIDCLERSYQFAKAFNEDMELRMALYRMGFMKTLPNLLKQETSSVSTYISILIKIEERTRADIEKRLIPLDPESKKRNVAAWRPVVVTILNAMIDFDDTQFKTHIPMF
ncbi:Sec7-domain-containing protein [Rhizoclosmatium globosum]|uniref:Sec7-domain-containing protein n=1 Tax=Rhizoclosmatium globosum TaxID=329046 RepID=A0A1Y2CRS7_9FUNG|nr:Sec7-domain-containing protein [Rhizoclosmatium globosum]|eukprot:ORY49065.1 Sec7-domain-containing protein [Rhizoclosmatium globosum]